MSRAHQLLAALDRAQDRSVIARRNLANFEASADLKNDVARRTARKLRHDLDSAERNARWVAHELETATASAEG